MSLKMSQIQMASQRSQNKRNIKPRKISRSIHTSMMTIYVWLIARLLHSTSCEYESAGITNYGNIRIFVFVSYDGSV